jgi:RNA:NAD 2'-phosphotransferase (TPT1/KptA family)
MLVVAADGGEQQLTFTYDTTGGETRNATGAEGGQSRGHWSGSELLIESVLRTPNRTFHFKDHWHCPRTVTGWSQVANAQPPAHNAHGTGL